MKHKPSLFKRLFSYYKIYSIESWYDEEENVRYDLNFFRNQWIISHEGRVIYSYGKEYPPFLFSFRKLYEEGGNPLPEKFLLLGTGLGSALSILQNVYKCYPESRLVELNPQFILWSQQYMNLNKKENVEWIEQDAYFYMLTETENYDLIGIDVFRGMRPMEFVLEIEFLQAAYLRLNPGGHIILNLIDAGIDHFDEKMDMIASEFGNITEYKLERNIFLIIQKNKVN